jgi:hypothetical protein
MGKKTFIAVMTAAVLFLSFTSVSYATTVFLNFDPPDFTPDASAGDFSHVYSTVAGDVHFNGRIWNKLGGDVTPDHTTGSDYFLKNTGAEDVLTILTFDFSVHSLSFWARVLDEDVLISGEAYDADNVLVGSGGIDASADGWVFNQVDFDSGIRKLVLYSNSGDGNNFAIDDLTLHAVPEPASMALFGSGLLGFVLKRKKKTS